MEKQLYQIIYCVDDDTQEEIDKFDNLDAARDEHENRYALAAVCESKEAAEEYLKGMGKAYAYCQRKHWVLHVDYDDIYNPDACTIKEYEMPKVYTLEEAKTEFETYDEAFDEAEK